jgi:exosome complex component MTR3
MQEALGPSIQLHLYPKAHIDVYINVMECDGEVSALASAIACASLAIADAGIDMYDIVTATSAVRAACADGVRYR